MAGKYIEFVNPGYSTLYTRDLKYVKNTSRGDDVDNPFNPDAANPIIEGEWLQLAPGLKAKRGGSATSAAGDNIAVSPCVLHFSERGRYDAQITQKAHVVTGPQGFEFTCKLGDFTGAAEGEFVFIADFENPAASGKYIQALYGADALVSANSNLSVPLLSTLSAEGSASAPTAAFWSPGWIVRKVSDSEAVIMFAPQLVPVVHS